MPVGSTSQRSVQVSGFGDYGHLTPLRRLIRFLFVRPAFCLGLPSDSQSPATPLPSANTSPCRVCRGLSPPSRQAHHHSEPDSASHGATRHAWRTIKGGLKPTHQGRRRPRWMDLSPPKGFLRSPQHACGMGFSPPARSARTTEVALDQPEQVEEYQHDGHRRAVAQQLPPGLEQPGVANADGLADHVTLQRSR